MGAEELSGSGTVKPNANKTFYRLLETTGAIDLVIDGSESFPGDEITVLVQATGATTVNVSGDAAPGSLAVGAGGVGAFTIVNGGGEDSPFFVGLVNLS